MVTKTKAGRQLSIGDVMFRQGKLCHPVKELGFATGQDGRDARMIGGQGVDTAYALRITLTDDSEILLHPGQEVEVRA